MEIKGTDKKMVPFGQSKVGMMGYWNIGDIFLEGFSERILLTH